MADTVSVLFVCLGNICRSPTAEGVFRARAARAGLLPHLRVDSCGTGDWHVGKKPDSRAIKAAASRGYDLSQLRARQLADEDFDRFDLILAMDHSNLRDVRARAACDTRADQRLFLSFHPNAPVSEVPDPYYGGEDGFRHVLDLVESASDGLLEHISRILDASPA